MLEWEKGHARHFVAYLYCFIFLDFQKAIYIPLLFCLNDHFKFVPLIIISLVLVNLGKEGDKRVLMGNVEVVVNLDC